MFKLKHINIAGNVVLLNSVEPGDKLARIKSTKHDDDDNKWKGGGGNPTGNGLSSYTNTDNNTTKNRVYYETFKYDV
jgi:hypothetical protein